MPPVGIPDLFVTTENSPTVAAETLTASQSVNGSGVDVKDRESVVVEFHVGTIAGSPTGGTVTVTIQHSSDNSTWATIVDPVTSQNATLVANYNDTLPEILRYRYIGDATNGKFRYARAQVTAALTGGTSPTVTCAVNVLKGALKYSGAQPKPGSYPQTPGTPLTN
jgi:hypothetical protein